MKLTLKSSNRYFLAKIAIYLLVLMVVVIICHWTQSKITETFTGRHLSASAHWLDIFYWCCQIPIIITVLRIITKINKLGKSRAQSLIINTDQKQLIHYQKNNSTQTGYYRLTSLNQGASRFKALLGLVDVKLNGQLLDGTLFAIIIPCVINDKDFFADLKATIVKSQTSEASTPSPARGYGYHYTPDGLPYFAEPKAQEATITQPVTPQASTEPLSYSPEKPTKKRRWPWQADDEEPSPEPINPIGQALRQHKASNHQDYMGLSKA